jgi:hypothetical protein
MGTILAEKTEEEHLRRDTAGEHQGFVAVVAVKPVLIVEMRPESHCSLMAGAGNVKKGLTSPREILLQRIETAGHFHISVKVQKDGGRCFFLGDLGHGYLQVVLVVSILAPPDGRSDRGGMATERKSTSKSP